MSVQTVCLPALSIVPLRADDYDLMIQRCLDERATAPAANEESERAPAPAARGGSEKAERAAVS